MLLEELPFTDNNILEKAKEFSFGASNWKPKTIIDKIREEGEYYYDYRINNKDKIPFTTEQFEIAQCIVQNILSSTKTSIFFVKEDNNKSIEMFSQRYIETYLYEVEVKGTPDLYIVNHNTKTIVLIDLKTSQNAYKFRQDIIKFGYAIQMSFYKDMLESIYEGYTVDTCINIVGDTNNCNVYTYLYNQNDLLIEKIGNKWLKGWLYYLKEIDWHIKNNIWNSTKEQETNGYINVCLH